MNKKQTLNNNENDSWNSINWETVTDYVYNLQTQVYEATRTNNITLALYIQEIIINSYDAKYLAVRTVTQVNSGKNTAGFDKVIVLNNKERDSIARNLKIDGEANLVRRVFIPKPGTTETRPLGIPTIIDRCKQCLVKFALEPQAEARFEQNSYGFRPGRKGIDAVSRIRSHLLFNGPCFVFDADMTKCFDSISHDYILQKIDSLPIIRQQIAAWLKAGIFYNGEITSNDTGTPQGGVISPLLANIALNGMQLAVFNHLKYHFGDVQAKKSLFVRYADDFVIIAPTLDMINSSKEACVKFLSPINLEVNDKKSRIIKTIEVNWENPNLTKVNPFSFLGFTFKQRFLSKHKAYRLKNGGPSSRILTTVTVDETRIQRHKASITELLKSINNVEQLITSLNKRIIGWCNYFKMSDSKFNQDFPRKMDLWLNSKVRKWIRKSTKQRGKVPEFWVESSKDWILYHTNKDNKRITLVKYGSFKWNIKDYRPMAYTYSFYNILEVNNEKLRIKNIKNLS